MAILLRALRVAAALAVLPFLPGLALPVCADSSSPLLAAYYDRHMAIIRGQTYYWSGDGPPRLLPVKVVAVGVGRDSYYVLTAGGDLRRFGRDPKRLELVMPGVSRFAAGASGVLAITKSGALWWLEKSSGTKTRIADNAFAAAVGDGANYYVTSAGALFVKGKAHRGQYGDGRLTRTQDFVQTATGVVAITAHTGHAIALKRTGDVVGTGGNIYGPVGRHGLGDKAVRWSRILSGARAIATGASHSVAIRQDGTLLAWGDGRGPEPVPVLGEVMAVAAGARSTIALRRDGSLWQWARGHAPKRLELRR